MKPDIERHILSTCLVSADAVAEVISILKKPEIFTLSDYQKTYSAIMHLYGENVPIDVISLNNTLEDLNGLRPGTGEDYSNSWLDFLLELSSEQSMHTGSVIHHCYLLIQESLKLNLNKLMGSAMRELQIPGADPMAVMDKLNERIEHWNAQITELKEEPFARAIARVIEKADAASKSESFITGIPSGLRQLDEYTKGFQPANLIVIAGRPAMGKTAEILQILWNVSVIQGVPSAFFSLEMSNEQLAQRVLAMGTQYKNAQIASGRKSNGERIDIGRLQMTGQQVGDAPLFVYEHIYDLSQLKAKIRHIVRAEGVKVVAIDYLELIETEDKDTRIRVNRITRGLKLLSKELGITIILLAQLSRAVEQRATKRPQMSDLKESGNIEQDADIIIFLLRPAYYFSQDENGQPTDQHLIQNIIAKNRNGSTHSDQEAINLWCDLSTNTVLNQAPAFPF